MCENDKKMCMVFYLTLSGADLNPSIQYFVCNIRKFQHFYYFNKRIKEYKQRLMEKENKINDLTNKVTKDGFVIIGVIGEFTTEDLLLFPKGNVGYLLKKNLLKNLYRCFIIKKKTLNLFVNRESN